MNKRIRKKQHANGVRAISSAIGQDISARGEPPTLAAFDSLRTVFAMRSDEALYLQTEDRMLSELGGICR
jgi:hypothetical protein